QWSRWTTRCVEAAAAEHSAHATRKKSTRNQLAGLDRAAAAERGETVFPGVPAMLIPCRLPFACSVRRGLACRKRLAGCVAAEVPSVAAAPGLARLGTPIYRFGRAVESGCGAGARSHARHRC